MKDMLLFNSFLVGSLQPDGGLQKKKKFMMPCSRNISRLGEDIWQN